MSQEAVQGTNVSFSVAAGGTGPYNYQWFFDGVALAQGTNSTLCVSNIQATNAGSYSVNVSSPFGSIASSNAVLTVDLLPVITAQPQSQTVLVGSNVLFSVNVAGQGLPSVASGTLQLWLRADTGVVTNASGQVSQWQDQSGNANHAFQSNPNLQPRLASAVGLFNRPVIRFNGVQSSTNGDYLHGTGNVGWSNALTAFTVYDAFAANSENVVWDVGIPGSGGASRGDMLSAGQLDFILWSDDYVAPFVVPTNTYRIRADRLNTNRNTLNVFDYSTNSSTNFNFTVSGANVPGAGYYVGGLDSSLPLVGASRNFNGDVVEWICYQGYLSDPDRLAVTTYLEQKYFQNNSAGAVSYQWQFNGTNIANATNAMLTLPNVQITNDGSYTVTVSNVFGATISSNAVLSVGFAPAITNQPQSQVVAQGTHVSFAVGASGTGPMSFQWYFNGIVLAQGTNSTLTLTNIQATNNGPYNVVVSSPYGSVPSSNAVLTVVLAPVIVSQPQSQTVTAGGNVTFSVGVTPLLPTVASGTLRVWLKADTGVVTNSAGLVSQWQDQSGNSNNASQSNTNLQPSVAAAAALGGRTVVRFNGIQNNTTGSYMNGAGSLGVANALTAFTVYDAFAVNNENIVWDIGVPGQQGTSRGDMLSAGQLDFIFWSDDYVAPFLVPTNTYRLRTDRLNTNLTTLNIFDYSSNSATNFTFSISGVGTSGAGYYIGGLNSSLQYVGSSRNFNGDIVEWICYSGYLSEMDRLAVTSYLEQKYFQPGAGSNLSYQWQHCGANIAGATNSSLTLTNVQWTNGGNYAVIVGHGVAFTISSNALLTVDVPSIIVGQPQSRFVTMPDGVNFAVAARGYPLPTFQWKINGTNVPGGTGAGLAIASVAPTDAGTYTVFVSNSFGAATSSNAVLLVNYLTATRQGQPQQVPTTNLTLPSNVQSGNTFTVSSVDSVSDQGGTVQLANGLITYTPPAGFTGEDMFDYVLTPASGPAITDTITVLVDACLVTGGAVNGGQATIQFAGLPGVTYSIEASSDLQTWVFIGSVTARADGRFEILDSNAGSYDHRFYRTSLP